MKRLEAADHVSRHQCAPGAARIEGPHRRGGADGARILGDDRGADRRVEASESFAADVAHELKNPLAAARSMAESRPMPRTRNSARRSCARSRTSSTAQQAHHRRVRRLAPRRRARAPTDGTFRRDRRRDQRFADLPRHSLERQSASGPRLRTCGFRRGVPRQWRSGTARPGADEPGGQRRLFSPTAAR